jgi:hypothetical protein
MIFGPYAMNISSTNEILEAAMFLCSNNLANNFPYSRMKKIKKERKEERKKEKKKKKKKKEVNYFCAR